MTDNGTASGGEVSHFTVRRAKHAKKLARLASQQQLDAHNVSVREALSKALNGNLTELQRIAAEGKDEKDRLRAIDIMARYGLGEPGSVSPESVRARIIQTVTIIRDSRDILTEAQAEQLIERIRAAWM